MPSADTLHRLLPVAAAMAALLGAGLAALLWMVFRTRPAPPPWPAALERFAAACPWRERDLLLLLALLAAARALRMGLGDSVAWDMLFFQGAILAGALTLARRKPRPFGAPVPARLIAGQALLRWLAILPLLWLAAFAWQLLLAAAGHAPDLQDAVQMFLAVDSPWARAGFVLFAVALVPFAEEILFRGILLPLLIRRAGPAAGLLLTALAFAALHADLGTFPALALFSVALSLALARTGTLWVPVAMHALFNAANLALLLALSRAGMV